MLIVFFMLTAVFATTEGLQFQFPEDDPTQLDIQPEESIHIKILGQNDYVVDRSPMTDVELNNYIRAKLAQNPEKPVIIQTKAEVPYFVMVDVFDLLKYLKVRNISIPTKTEVERWEAFGIFE